MLFPTVAATVLASFIPAILAFNDIETSDTATAGSPLAVTVTNDLSSSNSFDAGFDSYRVYLAITVPGWGTGPSCTLVNQTSINTTALSVTIPASVGASGNFYSIATIEMNSDPNADGPSGFEYSNTFSLEGGTGNWSQYELAGFTVGDPDGMPCTAYDCARQCSQKYYPDNTGSNETAAQNASDINTYNCISQCPGVTLQPLDGDDGATNTTVGGTSSSTTATSKSGTTVGHLPASSATVTASTSKATTPSTTTSSNKTPTSSSSSTSTSAKPSANQSPASNVPGLLSLISVVSILLLIVTCQNQI